MRNLRIFTCVWGDKHIDTFLRGTVRSLSWKSNKEALDGSTWNIVTKPPHSAKLKNEISERFPNIKVEVTEVPEWITNSQGGSIKTESLNHSNLILMHLIGEIKAGIELKCRTLLAPPDTVFGERSVANLLKIGEQEQTCVAVMHPRVHPEILEDPYFKTGNPCSNELLVKMSFEKHLHQSWKAAEVGCANQNSLIGGVSWRKLEAIGGEKLYAVQHRLPTVYLANWTPEDYAFFINQPSFGSYDHIWPGERLIRQERQRLVGSSDAVFICEVTDFDKNIPPWSPEHLKILQQHPDAFYRDNLHNCHNRLSVCMMRGR
jgi:hypothetical protein